MNEMHVEPPFPCHYVTSRNSYCKCIITSMAESKHVFLKITNCTLKWRWTFNVISALNWSGVYIYISIYIYNSFKYPVRWQKLLSSARSGSTALSYWNCVGGWWGQGITHAFTHCMMKKKELCIVTQKVHKNEWYVYNVCKPQKSLLTKEKSQPI